MNNRNRKKDKPTELLTISQCKYNPSSHFPFYYYLQNNIPYAKRDNYIPLFLHAWPTHNPVFIGEFSKHLLQYGKRLNSRWPMTTLELVSFSKTQVEEFSRRCCTQKSRGGHFYIAPPCDWIILSFRKSTRTSMGVCSDLTICQSYDGLKDWCSNMNAQYVTRLSFGENQPK